MSNIRPPNEKKGSYIPPYLDPEKVLDWVDI